MILHTLKIKETYLVQIMDGRKTFEIRKKDRDYQVGNLITFVKTDGTEYFSHLNKPILKITDVFQEEGYGLEEGYCILSFNILK